MLVLFAFLGIFEEQLDINILFNKLLFLTCGILNSVKTKVLFFLNCDFPIVFEKFIKYNQKKKKKRS